MEAKGVYLQTRSSLEVQQNSIFGANAPAGLIFSVAGVSAKPIAALHYLANWAVSRNA